MGYLSLSDKDRKDMLAKIGVKSVSDLFQSIPRSIQLSRELKAPDALSEPELVRRFASLSGANTFPGYLAFLGAGAYRHFIPAAVDYLSMRGEFVSPYTPYQPEISQGTLQSIFEFQTMICQLTEMDVANASLYDGASGAAEAVLMAARLAHKQKVLIASSIHPHYRRVIDTYTKNLGLQIEEIAYDGTGRVDMTDLAEKLDDQTAGVVIQSPNFFGVIEPFHEAAALAHGKQALSVYLVAEMASLGLLESPGSQGADIVAGEDSIVGNAVEFWRSLSGDYGLLQKLYQAAYPGRIAGRTRDVDGRTGYVLTLATREQHIRREKATSNICTNQALCALRATIFLEMLGEEGFMEMARQNFQKANYAFGKLTGIPGVRAKFQGPFFNEFVLEFKNTLERNRCVLKRG